MHRTLKLNSIFTVDCNVAIISLHFSMIQSFRFDSFFASHLATEKLNTLPNYIIDGFACERETKKHCDEKKRGQST